MLVVVVPVDSTLSLVGSKQLVGGRVECARLVVVVLVVGRKLSFVGRELFNG